MRSEREMMDVILTFAQNDRRVRAVMMEGSRLNKNAPADRFQDFDISYAVTGMEEYKSGDAWLDVFGRRVITQKPEAMPLFPPVWLGKCRMFGYLMTFEDGNRLDLKLLPVEDLPFYFEEADTLVKVLLDKDGLCPPLPAPSDAGFYVKKPEEVFVDNRCNEFWHLSTYVVKGLCRNEPLYALKHLNLMREQMLAMISWKAGLENGFAVSVGKAYKYLDRYVSKETWEAILKTYRNDTTDGIWDSLILCADLFQETSERVCSQLGYKHPEYGRNVAGYIRRFFPPDKREQMAGSREETGIQAENFKPAADLF